MQSGNSRYSAIIAHAGDYFLLNLFFVAGFAVTSVPTALTANHVLFFFYLNIVWFILSAVFGLYRTGRTINSANILSAYTKIIVFFFFLFLLFFQVHSLTYYTRDSVKMLFPGFFAALLVWELGIYYTFIYYQKKQYLSRVIILGRTETAENIYQYFQKNALTNYQCLGFIDTKQPNAAHSLGHFSDFKAIVSQYSVDEIFVAMDDIQAAEKILLAEWLNNNPVKVRLIPDLGNFSFHSIEMHYFGNIPVVALHPGPLSYRYNQLLKRSFDLAFSAVIILGVLSWMTVLLLLLDWIFERKGVFYRQLRTSLNGKTFTIMKFRSMVANAEADTRQAGYQDERITPMGSFLRRSSLDELPQFLNVFLGQMSVVGPRPHMLKHTEEYQQVVRSYSLRHLIKPGITGLAQVNGFRGEVKQISDIRGRVAMDIEYIRNWTFSLDFYIILRTCLLIVYPGMGAGASAVVRE
jgi:putative colanic acid biosysnthesis UDP-glucose lipid carrier transferase